MFSTLKSLPGISTTLIYQSQELTKAIESFKNFLTYFIEPYIEEVKDQEEYKMMYNMLDSNQTLLSVWITSQLKPHEEDGFEMLITKLGNSFHLEKCKFSADELEIIKKLFKKVLQKLTACV